MIWELPFSRFRQIVAAIELRQAEAHFLHKMELTWQTRTLATFSAFSGMNASEDLVAAASKVSLFSIEEEALENGGRYEDSTIGGPQPQGNEDINYADDPAVQAMVEQNLINAANRNARRKGPGFEQFVKQIRSPDR